MGYYGNQPATGDNDSFRILDDLSSQSETFDASSVSVVLTGNDTLTILNHRFTTGQRVVYSNGGGSDIGGLADSNAYYVIKVDKNIIKLATSYANAIANSNIDLTSVGSGTSHTLTVGFDGINTRFVATYNNGIKIALTRAAQLQISINGVIQQPQDSKTPSSGFGIDSDSVIVFSVAPSVSDVFWGNVIANNSSTFDISDNTVDTFEGDGTTTDFNLSKIPANNQNILVTLDGVVQYPSEGSAVRAYSVTGSLLSFVSAPAGGVDIQVRHIGFAGATSSAVTGFYGRTGNTVLTSADDVTVNTITSVSGLNVTGGSVGIGTDNPTTNFKLDVNGDLSLGEFGGVDNTYIDQKQNGHLNLINSGVNANSGSVRINKSNTIAGDTTYYRDFIVYDGKNNIIQFVDGSSGNIGIGTDNPSNRFHATQYTANTDVATFQIGSASAYTGFVNCRVGTTGSGSFIGGLYTPDGSLEGLQGTNGLIFSTSGSNLERLRIDSSGRLLKSGQASLTSTSLSHSIQVAASSEANAIAIIGREQDDIGELSFYEADKSTKLGELQYRQDHLNFRHRVGDIRFATGGLTERLRITSAGTLESYSPDDTTPNIKWRSNDTNWFGSLNQSVEGGTITSFLSCGGDWSANGTTYSAIKALAAYPTSAIAVHNQYNSNWGSEFVFLTKAGGSSTTDGAVSERLRITSGGNVQIANGNLVFSTSGTGIDFSATSDGSGTTTSELLDDYEEGTFTPAWGDGGSAYSSPIPTYNTQRGDYTKIGNVVYYDIHLITTAWNGAGGTLWAHGLPFASRSSGYQQGGGGIFCIQGVDDAAAISTLTTQIAPNTNRIELYFQTASTGGNYNGFGINSVNEAGTVDIRINGFYFTNS